MNCGKRFIIAEKGRAMGEEVILEGVGVMRDKELTLEEVEASTQSLRKDP